MALSDKQRAALQAPITSDIVKQREGGGGKQLDYIEHYRVVALLNEVFGNGSWSTNILELRLVNESERNGKFAASYVARVCMRGDGWSYEDVGFGTSLDRDPGAVHEKAAKEAVSDAEKRCARHLGWALGLALYEKPDAEGERTHVVGAEAEHVAAIDAAMTASDLDAALAAARRAMPRLGRAGALAVKSAKDRAHARLGIS